MLLSPISGRVPPRCSGSRAAVQAATGCQNCGVELRKSRRAESGCRRPAGREYRCVIRHFAGGFCELSQSIGQSVSGVGGHPAQNSLDRRTALLRDLLNQPSTSSGQRQGDVAPVGCRLTTVEQPGFGQPVTCPTGVGRIDVQLGGDRRQVHRSARVDEHQHPPLRNGHHVLNSRQRGRRDPDQCPRRAQHRVDLRRQPFVITGTGLRRRAHAWIFIGDTVRRKSSPGAPCAERGNRSQDRRRREQ